MKRSKKKVILPEIDPLIPEGYPIASPGSTGASTHATRRILVIGPSGKTKGVRAGELGLWRIRRANKCCIQGCIWNHLQILYSSTMSQHLPRELRPRRSYDPCQIIYHIPSRPIYIQYKARSNLLES